MAAILDAILNVPRVPAGSADKNGHFGNMHSHFFPIIWRISIFNILFRNVFSYQCNINYPCSNFVPGIRVVDWSNLTQHVRGHVTHIEPMNAAEWRQITCKERRLCASWGLLKFSRVSILTIPANTQPVVLLIPRTANGVVVYWQLFILMIYRMAKSCHLCWIPIIILSFHFVAFVQCWIKVLDGQSKNIEFCPVWFVI